MKAIFTEEQIRTIVREEIQRYESEKEEDFKRFIGVLHSNLSASGDKRTDECPEAKTCDNPESGISEYEN